MNILIIEDDINVRKMMYHMLASEEYKVSEASNGFEADLFLQSKIKYDLVITDIIMPEKDGIEVIRNLKQNHPKTRILAISGGGKINSSNYLTTAKVLGAHSALQKPFLKKDLINAISKAMG
jgi:DNA-binding NtrC family response regulator